MIIVKIKKINPTNLCVTAQVPKSKLGFEVDFTISIHYFK